MGPASMSLTLSAVASCMSHLKGSVPLGISVSLTLISRKYSHTSVNRLWMTRRVPPEVANRRLAK